MFKGCVLPVTERECHATTQSFENLSSSLCCCTLRSRKQVSDDRQFEAVVVGTLCQPA